MALSADDFAAFFNDVHGVRAFPWQERLARKVIEEGRWPGVLDLPTGVGKTAAMDVALFHLAVDLDRGSARRAPMRIAFVVDRRLVVDDAYARAERLERALESAGQGVVARVAAALRKHAGEGARPLVVRELRGGIPREDDWARTPVQPTVLCSTVDQVGSRLLFRGYGVSDSMKPVHAGLLGADCLILLDEAHVAEPFRQTLGWVETYRSRSWRGVDNPLPWGVALLTATPGMEKPGAFNLDEDDLANPLLKRRLDAEKPARLVFLTRSRSRRTPEKEEDDESSGEARDLPNRTKALAEEVAAAFKHFTRLENSVARPAIGVVVNRVARARAVFEQLKAEHAGTDVRLLIGPARPVDRDEVVEALTPVRTGAERQLERPLIIVATQCVEVGVDIDFDALVTEAAPLDALRQRFGRLNRAGRNIVPFASIVAWKSEVSGRYEDPVYAKAIKAAWDRLDAAASAQGREKVVDFGVRAFHVPLDPEALSPKEDAPILLPSHLDLLCQTSPIPAADPDIAFFLHGVGRQPDAVMVVWRADITGTEPDDDIRWLLGLVPPRAGEAISLPIWVVRRWLGTGRDAMLGTLGDAVTETPRGNRGWGREGKRVFRWKGDDDRSKWVWPSDIRPGDTIVVPAGHGGVDDYGWNPERQETATDVGARAARPFAGRRLAVRVGPGLGGEVRDETLAEALAGAESMRWKDLQTALLELGLPAELLKDLASLGHATRGRVFAYLDVYSRDAAGRPGGVVFVAPLGISEAANCGARASTEDDVAGSLMGLPVPLEEHCRDVAEMVTSFASAAGLPEDRQRDLEIAALLHDVGKADPRFQAWLHHDDPLGFDPTESSSVLAKSGRDLPRSARRVAGLPEHWRHEAFSVRLAPLASDFARVDDPELVLWLIGSHHGRGRILFPHADPADATPRALPSVMGLPEEIGAGAGPQSLAFTWNGADWALLYDRVRARYGTWELALMEAVLRLADHRASERESRRTR